MLGWAVPQTAKPDGLAGFSGRNSSRWSAPWPRAFGIGSLEMHRLKPSPRAKKGQEIPGTDYAVSEGDIRGMQLTGKVPENLGVTVCRMALLVYISKWII